MAGHKKSRDIRPDPDRPRHVFTVVRDGDFWFVKARDLDRVFTQVRRLDQAAEAARDVTALMLDVPPDSFEVTLRLTGEHAAAANQVRHARWQVRDAQSYLAATTEQVARTLAADGMSLRDIAIIVNLSHQRVAQILGDAASTETTNIEELMEALEASVRAARQARGQTPDDVPIAEREIA